MRCIDWGIGWTKTSKGARDQTERKESEKVKGKENNKNCMLVSRLIIDVEAVRWRNDSVLD